MGLFDRLFGKKEEPKIEEVVKEALENLDLSEDVDPTFTEVEEVSQEEAEVEIVEQAVFQEEEIQDTVEESQDSEPAVGVSQEEIEELPNSEELPEEEKLEHEGTVEENNSEVLEPEAPQTEETVQEKYDRSLKKTRTGFGARLNAFFANFRSVDEEFFEELEELLIMSDVGVQVASNLTEELRYEAKLENAKKPDVLRRVIIEKLVELYEKDGSYDESIHFQDNLTVMLFVGVNGVGKTTSIGKLAHRYKQAGKKVMLVAADTFRAGAVAQLAEWGRRVDVPVVTGPEKADPASVVFDGMERAVTEGIDILMIDTAGRLQNKDNLMAGWKRLVVLSNVLCQKHHMKPSWHLMHQQVKMP
ncbi:cell division protein FtsY [Streptococcus pneumoniae]|nr:cell division protein FtsY [Streptococcus pneumoniae]